MKQGKTLQALGRELQRQRNNRQDFLADTRSLKMSSNNCVSTVHLSLDGKIYDFGVNDMLISRLQVVSTFLSLLSENAG